jgi:2-iminobutanoate/2-iminopropanoate deaminase
VNKQHNPASVAAPIGAYSHGVEVPAGARWLHVAGEVGMAPDGSVPDDIEAQADHAWRNVVAVLESAGMGVEHLVHVNHWLVTESHFAAYAKVRARYLGDARPAATLMIVKALARPELLVEVGGVAAKAD